MREGATFYEVLGVDPDADIETIEDAYREQVKEYHPDVSDRPDARETFQRINRAREVLADRAERARYDRLGHETYLETQRRGRSTGDDGDASGGGEPPPQRRESAAGTAGRAGTGATAGERDSRTDASGSRTREPDTAGGATPGWFAFREALSAAALVAVAGCVVVGTAVLGEVVASVANERLVLAGGWMVVAVLAGQLAAGSARGLPDDVVRVQALPLALFVSAWYLRRVEGLDLLVGGLLAYGAFAALFRTSALVGRGTGSALRAALVWFLGTAPAVLVLSASRIAVAGRVGPVPVAELGDGMGGLGPTVGAALALGTPVAVALGYGFWRLGRALV